MRYTKGSKIVCHRFNGNVEPVANQAKPPEPPEPPKQEDKKEPQKVSIEELAKTNPELAEMLKEREEMKQKETERMEAERKRQEEDAQKKGEWEKLYGDSKKRVEELERDIDTTKKQLGKYAQSTKEILENTLKSIPADRHSLIPDSFSPREKLEYIMKNAKLLGASVTSAGAGVPKNDDGAPVNEEAKLIVEINDLQTKSQKQTLTPAEQTAFYEKAKQLKALRLKKSS